MKFQAALILIAIVVIAGSLNEVRKASVQASDSSAAAVAQRASTHGPTALAPVHENHPARASTHFEPLLLLLLGSTLFAAGTAIKLVLSRKLDSKSLAAIKDRRVLNTKNAAVSGR